MSGVVGAWLPAAEDEQLLQQLAPMLRALQQRGRGRIGYWTDAEAGLALGHCRAPTDTPLQPLSSDCGRYVLCLDGRLYNRGDLQAQLRDLPRSCSDARLLLQAIVEWGVERALSRVEGALVSAYGTVSRARCGWRVIRSVSGRCTTAGSRASSCSPRK
jgi:Asparagine synthase (glutamine-hydrolyzing)